MIANFQLCSSSRINAFTPSFDNPSISAGRSNYRGTNFIYLRNVYESTSLFGVMITMH
jgi:hypothetical protein